MAAIVYATAFTKNTAADEVFTKMGKAPSTT
jgi:hypothetical protein